MSERNLNVSKIIERVAKLESKQNQWKNLLDECYTYTQPNRNLFDDVKTVGTKKNVPVYDTTAVIATRSFVSNIENALNPQDSNWLKLEPSDNTPKEQKDKIAEDLQAITDRLMFYINHSNFYLASYESGYDLAIGTAALMITEGDDDKPLNFQSVPIKQIFPEENSFGVIDTVYRKFPRVKKRDLSSLWPQAKVEGNFKSFVDLAKDDADLEFIEGTIAEGTQDKPVYRYIVIHPGSGSIIVDEKTESSMWIVYRWGRLAMETMGRGPVVDALPTILTLNKMVEYELRSAAFKALPPFLGFADDVFNPWTARVEPNAIIPMNRNSIGEEPLRALNIPGNIQFSQLLTNDFREQINQMLFVNPLGRVDSPTKTATEVTIRQKIALEVMGPAFMRLQVEKLTPLINRCVWILQRRGLMPKFEVNGQFVKATYQSPLAESRRMEKVQSFNELYTNLQQILGPELSIGTVKISEIPTYLAKQYNADLDMINSKEEIEEALKQVQQQQQGQQDQGQQDQGQQDQEQQGQQGQQGLEQTQEPAPAFQAPQ